jgi:hypothetical protein
MYGTRTALGDPTPKLGPGQAYQIAEHPQERHILWSLDATIFTVDAQGDHLVMVGMVSLS